MSGQAAASLVQLQPTRKEQSKSIVLLFNLLTNEFMDDNDHENIALSINRLLTVTGSWTMAHFAGDSLETP